jgi:hypothetical protein
MGQVLKHEHRHLITNNVEATSNSPDHSRVGSGDISYLW